MKKALGSPLVIAGLAGLAVLVEVLLVGLRDLEAKSVQLPTAGAVFSFRAVEVSINTPQGLKTVTLPAGSVRWNDFVIEVNVAPNGSLAGVMRRVSDGKSFPLADHECLALLMEFASMLDYFSDSEKWFANGGIYSSPPKSGGQAQGTKEQKISWSK
jgi:hypothetical protein